jgi:hypothetical protein
MMELSRHWYSYSYSTVPAQFIFLDGSAFVRIVPDLMCQVLTCCTIKGICSSVHPYEERAQNGQLRIMHLRRFLRDLLEDRTTGRLMAVASETDWGSVKGIASYGHMWWRKEQIVTGHQSPDIVEGRQP